MSSNMDNIEDTDKYKKGGYYGMSESAEAAKNDNEWSAVQDELGEPEEVRQRSERDDAAFEDQTRLPGTSSSKTPEEDKGVLQKGIDKLGELSNEASKEYLAS